MYKLHLRRRVTWHTGREWDGVSFGRLAHLHKLRGADVRPRAAKRCVLVGSRRDALARASRADGEARRGDVTQRTRLICTDARHGACVRRLRVRALPWSNETGEADGPARHAPQRPLRVVCADTWARRAGAIRTGARRGGKRVGIAERCSRLLTQWCGLISAPVNDGLGGLHTVLRPESAAVPACSDRTVVSRVVCRWPLADRLTRSFTALADGERNAGKLRRTDCV
jgi:hypothetical protein